MEPPVKKSVASVIIQYKYILHKQIVLFALSDWLAGR